MIAALSMHVAFPLNRMVPHPQALPPSSVQLIQPLCLEPAAPRFSLIPLSHQATTQKSGGACCCGISGSTYLLKYLLKAHGFSIAQPRRGLSNSMFSLAFFRLLQSWPNPGLPAGFQIPVSYKPIPTADTPRSLLIYMVLVCCAWHASYGFSTK
jgi:hypothetical protein